MIIDPANSKLKMVVIIATALALGIGAVAACVVPWLYCNPADNADDDREATAIRDNAASESQLSRKHNNNPTDTQIRINGVSFVKIVHIAAESSAIPDSEKSTNAHSDAENSVALEAPVSENSANGQPRVTDQAKQIRRNRIAERTKKSENASRATDTSSGSRSSETAITNIRIIQQSLEKSVSTDDPSLVIKFEENVTDATKSSIPTDESSTGTTVRTSSGTSGLVNSAITDQTDERTSESTNSSNNEESVESKFANKRRLRNELKFESTDRRSPKVRFLETELLDRIEEDNSTSPQKFDLSNPTDDTFIETTHEASTSEESESSAGQTKLAVVAIIETTKSAEVLETIPEAPLRSASSHGAASTALPSRTVLPTFSESSDRKIRDEVSSTSTISSCNSRSKILSFAVPMAAFPLRPECRTPNSTQSTSYSRPCNDRKTISLIRKSLSRRINRIFRGRKVDRTPRSSCEEIRQPLYTDSVQSLSAGKEVPVGNSTRISEDQRPLETIRGSKSMTTFNDLSKRFSDPRVLDVHPNEIDRLLQIDEEPLDLSIHSSGRDEKTKNFLTSERKDQSGTSGFSREVLRDVKQRLRTRTSDDGTTRSDSIKFYGDSSKSFVRDENQNFQSDSLTIAERVNFDETRERNSDSDANVTDRGKSEEKRKQRWYKSLSIFGKKNQSKENDKVSTSGSKRKGLDTVPVECQRHSTSSKSNENFNAKVESISESPADSYYYIAFNNTVRNDEPTTEL